MQMCHMLDKHLIFLKIQEVRGIIHIIIKQASYPEQKDY